MGNGDDAVVNRLIDDHVDHLVDAGLGGDEDDDGTLPRISVLATSRSNRPLSSS